MVPYMRAMNNKLPIRSADPDSSDSKLLLL